MSKNYPKYLQEQNNVVTTDTLNVNTGNWVADWNGGIDSHNIAPLSVNHLHFTEGVYTDLSTANVTRKDWVGNTQKYSWVGRTSLTQGGNIFAPLYNVDLKTYDWGKGWNKLTDVANGFEDLLIDTSVREGMLNGIACIDMRHGMNVYVYSSEPLLYAATGWSWWTKWGIFVNDILVAETGECYPRLENLVLPFSIPVGSQNIKVDLRWKTITSTETSQGGTGSTTEVNVTTDLELFGAQIWVRNTYR